MILLIIKIKFVSVIKIFQYKNIIFYIINNGFSKKLWNTMITLGLIITVIRIYYIYHLINISAV